MILVADGDFGQFRVRVIRGAGKRGRGPLSGKDLRAENCTLPPVNIFPNHAPAPLLFQARSGTARSRA